MPHTTPPETPTPSWTAETVMLINKLTPDIKDKSSDPDWFLLRQRFEEMERQLTAATADHKRLVRELDVLLNGDKAAAQASLCDIVAQVRKYSEKLRAVLAEAS